MSQAALQTDSESLLAALRVVLAELFEIEPAAVVPAARLREDLDLDSIDAVDLTLELRTRLQRPVDPRAFRETRTVGEVIAVIQRLADASPAA